MQPLRAKIGALVRGASVATSGKRIGVHFWLSENPYHEVLYSEFHGPAAPQPLSLLEELVAFTSLSGSDRILWIHSEASYSWGEQGAAVEKRYQTYIGCLRKWVQKGGTLIWTLHDTGLHLSDSNPERIAAIREILRHSSVLVHVHSQGARDVVIREFDLDPARIVVVRHPSYATHYGTSERLVADDAAQRKLLCFGQLKPYKNFAGLADALLEMRDGSFGGMTIAGNKSGEVDLREAEVGAKLSLDLRLRYIPDEEVPALFAGAHFLVLPYVESLTSGAAALSMGFGVPIIASDLGGMRESAPEENWPLLYAPDDPDGLRTALERARDMSPEDYGALRRACVAFGNEIHPSRISSELLGILDERGLLPQVRNSVA